VLALLGLTLSLAALGYGVWVVIEYFWLGNPVRGYPTLAAGMMFLSGVQLMSVGLLAEYVARIYDEVKQRPLYLVADEVGEGLPGARSREPGAHGVLVCRRGRGRGGHARGGVRPGQVRLWPELANALGFVVAFGVSFVGHRWLSFRGAGTGVGRACGALPSPPWPALR
jgi:hypothetical protein